MSTSQATPVAAAELRSALAKKQLRTAGVGALWSALADKDLLGLQVATPQKDGASTLTRTASPPVVAMRQWLCSHLSAEDVAKYDCGTLGAAMATTCALVPPALLDASTLPDAMEAVVDVHDRFVPDAQVLQSVRDALQQRGRAKAAVPVVKAAEAEQAPALDALASDMKKPAKKSAKKAEAPLADGVELSDASDVE